MPRVTTALALTALAALAASVVSSETDAPASSDSTELLFGVITPKCYDAFVQHHDFGNTECIKFVISKLLSYAIISGAFILKLPQILKIVAAKDVTGLTPSSFYMEVVLCASSSAYNLLRGYPLSTWGETLVILAQNIILVMLLWAYHVPKIGYSTRLGLTVVFGLASAAMMLTPPEHQWLLMSASIPVTIVARAPQVFTNFKQGHTGQLAFITLLLNFGGTVARMFTTLQETGDPVQIAGLAVAMTLNGLLVLQVVIYWNATKKALAAAAKKKAE